MTTQSGYRSGRVRRQAACLAFALLVSASGACSPTHEEPPASPEGRRGGGTLHVAPADLESGLDPQKAYLFADAELFRCCLARTLYSYPGRPTAEGGTVLHPDLAAAMPTVSRDDLTWTIQIKEGLRYAPPYDDVKITSGDFIRALERTAEGIDTNYGYNHSAIDGFDAFAAGKAETIAGLEAPDDRTLRIHLTQPTGDLAARLALPHTTPIPPTGSGARLGAAAGLSEYGPFLASTGPYMYEGSDRVDLTQPSSEREPAEGYDLPRSLTLVRNPSWDPASDPLRKAYVDRIEVVEVSDRIAVQRVESGSVDVYLGDVPAGMIRRYGRRPESARRLHFNHTNGTVYVSFNLGLPPLDDVHVRRAINFVIDKASIAERARQPHSALGTNGAPADHLLPDSLVNNLLVDYHPYDSGARGDIPSARREMALSKYDRDGDGRCDGRVCEGLRLPAAEAFILTADVLKHDLKRLGIGVSVKEVNIATYFEEGPDPRAQNHFFINGWLTDYLSPSTFIVPLFYGPAIVEPGNLNHSLLGAPPTQLRTWGYPVTDVPTIDDLAEECLGLVGASQIPCWAEVDQVLMENVVPLAPLLHTSSTVVVSDRVTAYSFAQFSASPALDRIAVK